VGYQLFLVESNLFAMPVVRDFLSFLRIADDPGRSEMDITRLMTLSGISEQNIAEINRIAKKMAYSDPTDIDFVFETLKNSKDLNVAQKHILRELRNQLCKNDLKNKIIKRRKKSTVHRPISELSIFL
jgi:hypothetical protein